MSQPSIGPNCWACKHIHADYTCEAFQEGIPAVIALGDPHIDAVSGDKGIRFEPRGESDPMPAFISLMLPELEDDRPPLPDDPTAAVTDLEPVY